MSVGGILEALQQGLSGGSDRSLLLQADSDFASTLTLGKIIKGRVLRHYEGERYGMSIGGQEKVVDTALPLRIGELVHARVVNIGEKVHLQRIVEPGGQALDDSKGFNNVALNQAGVENRDEIARLFARYQATLTTEQHGLLKQLQGRWGGTDQVALSGLILSKLGVKLEPAFVKAIGRVLAELKSSAAPLTTNVGPALPAHAGQNGIPAELVDGLAPLLSKLLDEDFTGRPDSAGTAATDNADEGVGLAGPDVGERDLDGGSKEQQEWFLGQWLLNVQTEGLVAHRFLRFPLWFGERLTEVSMALFAQKEQGQQGHEDEAGTLRFRKAVFSLETDNLGHLEIEARVAVRNLRLKVTAGSVEKAELLGSRLSVLETVLRQYDWQVDEITYHTRSQQEGVMQAVVEHYINQDSFSRLM